MAGKDLDWLPEGWTVEVKVGSGGTKTKFYTDPRTGKKFKSRPDVLRYLYGEAHMPKKRKVPTGRSSVVQDQNILKDEMPMEDGEQAMASFQHPPDVPSLKQPLSVPDEWLVGPDSNFFASVIEEFSISYGFTLALARNSNLL